YAVRGVDGARQARVEVTTYARCRYRIDPRMETGRHHRHDVQALGAHSEARPWHRGSAMNAQDESQILDALTKWLDRDVRPYARELEKNDEYPESMVEQMKALGLFGATIPQQYGGLGLPASTYAKVV